MQPHIRHLFAYGTLRPGLAPPALSGTLARLAPLGPAEVRGRLYDLGPFPAAVPDPAAPTTIKGIVLRLPGEPQVLTALDDYEGPGFQRVECLAGLRDGSLVPCWIYAYAGTLRDAPRIDSGVWPAASPTSDPGASGPDPDSSRPGS